MSLTDNVKTLGYDPEQTGQLLNIVRQNFLQLESFEQLPDDRLEKMGLPIAVIYAVRISLVRAPNHLLRPCKHRESKNQLSTQREVPQCRFELRSLRLSQLMCMSRLRLKTLERSQEVSSQKLRATK